MTERARSGRAHFSRGGRDSGYCYEYKDNAVWGMILAKMFASHVEICNHVFESHVEICKHVLRLMWTHTILHMWLLQLFCRGRPETQRAICNHKESDFPSTPAHRLNTTVAIEPLVRTLAQLYSTVMLSNQSRYINIKWINWLSKYFDAFDLKRLEYSLYNQKQGNSSTSL